MASELNNPLSTEQRVRAEALKLAGATMSAGMVFGRTPPKDVGDLLMVADWIVGGAIGEHKTESDPLDTLMEAIGGQFIELPIPQGMSPLDVIDLIRSLATTGKCSDPDCQACGDKPVEPQPTNTTVGEALDDPEDDRISVYAEDPMKGLWDPADLSGGEADSENDMADRTQPIPVISNSEETEFRKVDQPLPVGDWKSDAKGSDNTGS